MRHLGGDTLGDDGKYKPIQIVSESETRHWGYSEVLGLEIWWYDGILRLRDPVTGEFLHATPEESEEAIETAEASSRVCRASGPESPPSGGLNPSERRVSPMKRAWQRWKPSYAV